MGGEIACPAPGDGCALGIFVGVESEAVDEAPMRAFTGALSDLRVYETALTAEEIDAL